MGGTKKESSETSGLGQRVAAIVAFERMFGGT